MDGKERGGGFINAEVGVRFLTQRGRGAEWQRGVKLPNGMRQRNFESLSLCDKINTEAEWQRGTERGMKMPDGMREWNFESLS